jgi:hypothetical protein
VGKTGEEFDFCDTDFEDPVGDIRLELVKGVKVRPQP